MISGPKENSLFCNEENILSEAEAALCSELFKHNPAAPLFEDLMGKYRKLFRQTQSLVKISDRMQNDLNELNERLGKSEEKYRQLFENMAEGIYRCLPDGTLVDVNPAMAQTLGFGSPAEMIEKSPNIARSHFLSPDDWDHLLDALTNREDHFGYQIQLRRIDGSQIWVAVSARAKMDREGRLLLIEGLILDITEQKRLQEELHFLATTDSLTSLANRRHFLDLTEKELSRTKRYGLKLSLIMIDVDRFKLINDTHGHDTGDQVLLSLANLGRQSIREHDLMGRLGGEEFTILLPETDTEGATRLAERFRETIAKTAIETSKGTVRITISLGVTTYSAKTRDVNSLLKWADSALYQAKAKGRNRVEVYIP